ncbi:MAG: DUF4240 domain-containing protein [Pirellula sp.]
MQLAQFWKMIDNARLAVVDSPDERDDFLVQIEEALLELAPSEVASFHTHLLQQFNRTFHWDVIAAAAIIYGDQCDPLDIDGFRAWLISRGEDFLTNTLQDVDSLGPLNLVPDDLYYYAFLGLPNDVYEELSGDELPADATPPEPEEPAGQEFQVKDLPLRLPKLADDFGLFPPAPDVPVTLTTEAGTDADFEKLLGDVSDEENPYADL